MHLSFCCSETSQICSGLMAKVKLSRLPIKPYPIPHKCVCMHTCACMCTCTYKHIHTRSIVILLRLSKLMSCPPGATYSFLIPHFYVPTYHFFKELERHYKCLPPPKHTPSQGYLFFPKSWLVVSLSLISHWINYHVVLSWGSSILNSFLNRIPHNLFYSP